MKTIRKLYIFLFTLVYYPVYNQVNQFFSIDNGLSNNSITYIYKDSHGYIWIGTTDGLNRYNGNNFVIFKHDPSNSNSISDNFMSSIVEDPDGNLWIGTQGGGLNRFNTYTEEFTTFYHDPENDNSLPSNYIFHHNSLLIDNNSVLWVGTNNGLCKYDIKQNKFTRIELNVGNENDFRDIRAIFQDTNGDLWIGTNSGLIKFSQENNIKEIYRQDPLNSKSISNNIITCILESKSKKELWIGTEYGLNILNKVTGEIKTFFSANGKTNSLSDNSITSIVTDDNNNIWIGTKSGGVNKYNVNNGSFSHFKHTPSGIKSISDNYIEYIFYDNTGLLWLGTVNAGLNVIDINKKKFTLIRNDPANINSLSYNTIRSICEDKDGIVWIGTYGGGLNRYDGRNYMHFFHQSSDINSLSHNIISSFCEDENGNLWIGTWGGGINILDKKTFRIKRNPVEVNEFINDIYLDSKGKIWIGSNKQLYIYDPLLKKIINFDINNKLTSTSINKILEDKNGQFWIATWDGLNHVFLKDGSYEIEKVKQYKKDPDNNSISENRLTVIYEDGNQVIWIGTYGGGLNKLERGNDENVKFIYYNYEDGLPGNIIYGILEDNHGNLWISTNNGLSKFDMKQKAFHNYDVNDGLQGNQFYWNAFMKSSSGEMYFGGINGLNVFHPDSINYKEEFPKVVLTDLLLFNKSVKVGEIEKGKKILDKSITYTAKVKLERKDYAFSIEFAALTYKSQSKIKYAYKLENFDPEWIQTDSKKRFATYSHLRPGNYIFKVKSTNADGEWNDNFKQIGIKILPAYYETLWAFILYGIILFFLLINFRSQILSRARYKHDIQLERIERENAEAYNDMKLQFFTNISHEFKTPLTLILGPLENILTIKNLDKYLKEQLKLMQSGSKRMFRLINQLMEFRKVETGNYRLKITNRDIIPLVKETVMLFKSKSIQNKIKYILHIPVKSVTVWFDENVIETIIYNLLSNAFKFTGNDGIIKVSISFVNDDEADIIPSKEECRYMVMKISDTGVGITKERLENIFKRFYQIDTFSEQKRGTGIGLALTKDLVEAHHGQISVESELGVGATFIVKIPVHKSLYNENEIISDTTENNYRMQSEKQLYELEEIQVNEDLDIIEFKKPDNKNAPLILIVEDDIELIKYLGKMLEEKFNLLIANNGREGLKVAIKNEPDLIISDIMMPEMNGFELCEKIKTDISISHVPVILLTALSATDDMIKGYTIGADYYIPKPFHQELLLARIENIINQRKQLRLNFQKKFSYTSGTKDLPTVDEKFLKKVMDYIQTNLSKTEMNVESIGKEIGISTTHLYRKIKSLTGLSTNELIRKARLKKAAELLAAKQGNVSQVMYDVGFSNHSYFSKCFQEEYGVSPKEYIK